MKTLFIINDPPYGTERVYNALRLAPALVKKDPGHEMTVFLMADAVFAAKANQKTPEHSEGCTSASRALTSARLKCGAEGRRAPASARIKDRAGLPGAREIVGGEGIG